MDRAKQNVFVRLLVVALLLALRRNLLAGDVRYESGRLINLATVRGTIATASDNLRKDHPAAGFLLHKAEGEIRFDNHFGPCWWMMELPAAYDVSDLRLLFRDVITSVGVQIKVAEEAPVDWAKVPIVASFNGPLVRGSSGAGVAELHFNPTKAKFVRVEFVGHNGGEKGAGGGHEDLVISGIQVWGP